MLGVNMIGTRNNLSNFWEFVFTYLNHPRYAACGSNCYGPWEIHISTVGKSSTGRKYRRCQPWQRFTLLSAF